MFNYLNALIIFCSFGLNFVTANFEENKKFCIRTEPLLLTELTEINGNLTVGGNRTCEILATTLTVKEKESLLNILCKNHGNIELDDYHYFQLHNGDLKERSSYHKICAGKTNPLLAWIPYALIQQNFAQELDPKEHTNYLAKATDIAREKTELCHFRHTDLVKNISSNLFTCTLMLFEDNFFGLDANINVLVEIQPIFYEIRNLTYLPWANVSTSYKTLLGQTVLKNPSHDIKQIYGSINYAFVEKVKLNVSTVYGEHLNKIPLLFEHKSSVLELNENGVGGVNIKDRTYFGRVMDPKSKVNVYITGQWAEVRQQFTADIYEYFGYGIKRFRHELKNGEVAFVRIDHTEPVYELPDMTHLTNVTLYKAEDNETLEQKFGRLTADENAKIDNEVEWQESRKTDGHPYPGFYPWFIAGALIVGGVLLLSLIGIIRACSEKEDKQKYKFTEITA